MSTDQFVAALDSGGYKPRKSPGGWMSRCPGHEDRSPSLSISDGHDGRVLLKCFAGCTAEQIVAGLGLKEADLFPATRRINIPSAVVKPPAKPLTVEEPRAKDWPEFTAPIENGTMEEHLAHLLLGRVATVRGLSVAGLMLAGQRGLLRFCGWAGTLAWVVTDETRQNAQVRRLDGKPWPEIGEKKAWTLKGSRAAWPIGVSESLPFKTVLLTEGGPDLLAAHHFVTVGGREHDVAAVGMLGAGNRIHDDGLPLFTGKRIRIFAHTDQAGIAGANRWKDQLRQVAAQVDIADMRGIVRFDGLDVKDLNDAALIRPEDVHRLDGMIP